jgi:tryptophan synthase alpha chain
MKAERIGERFHSLVEAGHRALIPYIVAGDPDLETAAEIVRTLARSGADLIELGMPFSDPLADGPAIQAAGQRALKKGVTCRDVFNLVRQLRGDLNLPILIMTYYNPVFRYGIERYVHDAEESGVSGLIIPDLPLEEADPVHRVTVESKVDLVFLAAPTTPQDRVRVLGEKTRGFLYYVSRTGVTGERKSLAEDLERNLAFIRSQVRVPVAVGFGIKDVEQARMVARLADGVIIGSAIVRIVEQYGATRELSARIGDFVGPISNALHSQEWVKGSADGGGEEKQVGR